MAKRRRIFYKWTTHERQQRTPEEERLQFSRSEKGATETPTAPTPNGDGQAPGGLDAGNAMVLLTIASVVVSTAVGVPWVTTILHVGAVFPFYYRAMKQHRHRSSLALVGRWAAAAFSCTMVLGAFAPSRVEGSLFFSSAAVRIIENWLTKPQASPPADYAYLLGGLAAFLAGTLVTGGLLGLAIASLALGAAASGALSLFEHGNNVLQIAVVAIPPWQWSMFASAGFFIVPTARLFFDRFVRTERVAEEKRVIITLVYAGAACVVLSVLIRWATADAFHNLVRRWTTFL